MVSGVEAGEGLHGVLSRKDDSARGGLGGVGGEQVGGRRVGVEEGPTEEQRGGGMEVQRGKREKRGGRVGYSLVLVIDILNGRRRRVLSGEEVGGEGGHRW